MTITFTGMAVAVVGLLLAAGVLAAAAWRRRLPGRGWRDSIRFAVYLSRYASALEYHGLRRREIVDHVDQMRADLLDAGDVDLDLMLARLGPPRALAAAVTSGVVRASALRGAIWAAAALVVVLGVTLFAVEAFLGAFESTADPGEVASWSGLGIGVDATMGDDGRASAIGFGGVAMLLVPLVAGLVGARVWRVIPRFARQPVT